MSQKISVGIDIGSSTIKVIVVESLREDKSKPRVIGVGYAESDGLRHGYITSPEDAAKALRRAIHEAQKTSGYKIEKAYFGIGCAGLEGVVGSSILELGTKETVVTTSDIEQALELCQNELNATVTRNREVLHAIPLSFKIDGKQIFGKPQGMSGLNLEVKAIFITALSQHLNSLLETARLAGIGIEDIVASPIAASITLLSKSQQVAGCGLLIVGSESVSLSIFENGVPISVEVSPLGSRDITNDLALGFKVSLEEAERIKMSRPESLPYPRRKLEEIVKARLEDTCDFVHTTLKKIGKNGLLPAGILITGGGAMSVYIEELVKEKLKLPAKKIGIKFDGETKFPLNDATWSIAYGLGMIGIERGGESGGDFNFGGTFIKSARSGFMRSLKKLGKLIKRILP
ncbi:MAG: Cell division protein FtsA [Candidatus Taylorbacteria bacterium]|nr:Cell division protein FtsA [Candidatus Taylorbacteria bacterium]